MRVTRAGRYCTIKQAAAVLGYTPADLRGLLNTGRLHLGEITQHDRRTEYKIERALVLKEARLKEWPEPDTTTPAEAAAEAGRILKEAGMDVGKIAEILLESGCISKPMEKRMRGAVRNDFR